MLNNLFGDFVKGKDLSHFPEEIRQGIYLHRRIDDFIDRFPKVGELQQLMRGDMPKVSSIAIDLFFDHLLAKNWERYHHEKLSVFLDRFYSGIRLDQPLYTEEFKYMVSRMIEMNWIGHYHLLDGLDKMCRGVSSRISFENSLRNGKEVFLKHESAVSQAFEQYMEAAIQKFNVDLSK
jgi:acyl carrier protein phosphodiesterase